MRRAESTGRLSLLVYLARDCDVTRRCSRLVQALLEQTPTLFWPEPLRCVVSITTVSDAWSVVDFRGKQATRR